jgi:RNA processing factor Prp31
MKHANTKVDYEQKDGKIQSIYLAEALDNMIMENIMRLTSLWHLIFPELSKYSYLPSDWR